MALATSYFDANLAIGDRFNDKKIGRIIDAVAGKCVWIPKDDDISYEFYADIVQQNDAAGQINEGLTFADLAVGFPAAAEPGDMIVTRAGGSTLFDSGDGAGVIAHPIAVGEAYEKMAGGQWVKRVSSDPSPKLFKNLWEAYTINGASVAGIDDLTFVSLLDSVPARFDMGAGGAADEIKYDLGVNNYLGNVLIKKQPNVVMMKLTWPGGSAVNLFVHPTGKVQQMAGSNANIQIGGVAIADATGVIDEAHANNIVISDTPSGAEWIIPLTADASAGDVTNLSIGFSTFAAGGGTIAGPLELAFDIHSLVGNHVEPVRNDVTINGTLYSSDPGGMLGHQGATAISPTRYFITLPPSMEIDTVTIDSGGGSFYQPANISNAIDVTGAGAPQVITVTFRLATATLLESRVMIVASPDETTEIAGPETLTIPSAKTVGDLLNEYDELIFTAQETSLSNLAYSASVITSEYRVNIANGDTRIALGTMFFTIARNFWIDNVEETDTEFVLNKSTGNSHKNFKVWGIKKLAVDPATVIVPAPDVNIAAVGGLNTINGAATFTVPQGQPASIQLDMAAGQQIDTATLPAIDGTGATLKVIDVIAGTVTVVAAADSTAVTFATKASAIAETPNFVGSFDLGNANLDSAAFWDTGLDFTIPNSEIRIKQSANRSDNLYSHYSQPVPVRIFDHPESMKSGFFSNATLNYINIEIESAADAAIGRVRLDANTTCYAQSIELWTRSPRAFAVPVAYQAANEFNLSVTGAKGTINGLATGLFKPREGVQYTPVIDLNDGMQIDTLVDGAGDPVIHNPLTGQIQWLGRAADDVLVVTEKANAVARNWNFVKRWDAPEYVAGTTLNNIDITGTLDTDLDLTIPDSALVFIYSSGNNGADPLNVARSSMSGTIEYGQDKRASFIQNSVSGSVAFQIPSAAQAAAGFIQYNATTTCYLVAIEQYTLSPRAFHVPDSMVASTLMTITGNAGAQLVSGVAAQGQTVRMQLEMAGGQMLNLLAPPTIDLAGATVTIDDHLAGTVNVYSPIGATATADITYATIPAPLWTPEYLHAIATIQSNANAADHVQFNKIEHQVGSNIILDTTSPYSTANGTASIGRITLKANTGTYEVRGATQTNATNYRTDRWADRTTGNTVLGVAGYRTGTNLVGAGTGTDATTLITPLVDTIIELQTGVKGNGTVYRTSDVWGGCNVTIQRIREV